MKTRFSFKNHLSHTFFIYIAAIAVTSLGCSYGIMLKTNPKDFEKFSIFTEASFINETSFRNQMNDVLPDNVDLTAVPFGHGISVQHIEIFVISVNEQERKLLAFQPIEPVLLGVAVVPDAAEIAADYNVTLFVNEKMRPKALEIGMSVAGDIYFHAEYSSLNGQ